MFKSKIQKIDANGELIHFVPDSRITSSTPGLVRKSRFLDGYCDVFVTKSMIVACISKFGNCEFSIDPKEIIFKRIPEIAWFVDNAIGVIWAVKDTYKTGKRNRVCCFIAGCRRIGDTMKLAFPAVAIRLFIPKYE
ncbi:hypothetical protein [Desulfosarcina cetonica]|uniref:hypothetical protein n=1 Tax=Desulfosarcina cetonica TaxID=90730 RepID=UPI0006D068FD|nr:hypothetical protein [Desulfosarcina cetonica]